MVSAVVLWMHVAAQAVLVLQARRWLGIHFGSACAFNHSIIEEPPMSKSKPMPMKPTKKGGKKGC